MVYRYALNPLYRLFPKPGEFYKVTRYLSSTNSVENKQSDDMIGRQITPDPLSPLWSGVGFMVLMLTVSCGVFHFKDY